MSTARLLATHLAASANQEERHMDMYDSPGVALAMSKLAPFFNGNL